MNERSPSAPLVRSDALEPLALLDHLPGALLLLDGAGRVTYLNGSAERRLTRARSTVVGRDLFREVIPELEEEGIGERFRTAMLGGRVELACEVSLDGASPRRFGLELRSFVDQGTLRAAALIEDRTPLALEEARRERAEQLATVGELATGVAHEINNPLASIKGFAQLLSRETTRQDHLQALEIISHECTRVARTIDGLLDFASQQRVRGRESLSLSVLVDGALDLRQYALETSGIEVRRELDPSLSPVLGERGALQRVVLALLRHAERSLGSQTRERRLVARTRESTDGVVLYLMDNGPGISRDRLRSLFTTPEEDAECGTDLLAARSIVLDHGGQLSADSIEGEGTAFFVRLPRWEGPVGPTIAPATAQPLNAPVNSGAARRPLRVLVADDEATFRLALALFLGRYGHQVVQAEDAYEAHRLASEQSFDVVLADARMPGDGLALLEKLDAMPEFTGRTILITGDHPFAADAIRSGRPYLAKPFDLTEVVRLLETLTR